jgi:hypothetical protein
MKNTKLRFISNWINKCAKDLPKSATDAAPLLIGEKIRISH